MAAVQRGRLGWTLGSPTFHRTISVTPLDSRKLADATLRAWPQPIVNAGPVSGRSWPGSDQGYPPAGVPVLELNPEAMKPDPLPGYVWLDTPGKVLHAPEDALEFRESEV